MITIELLPEERESVRALVAAHPDLIQQVKVRNATGGGGDMTYLISIAAIVVPAIRAVLIEWIKAGRYKTISMPFKGKKITSQSYSADDIVKILEEMKDKTAKV